MNMIYSFYCLYIYLCVTGIDFCTFICVSRVQILPPFSIFFEWVFGTVLVVWYVSVFHFISEWTIINSSLVQFNYTCIWYIRALRRRMCDEQEKITFFNHLLAAPQCFMLTDLIIVSLCIVFFSLQIWIVYLNKWTTY